MPDSALIDAGPIIAIVARRDAWHRICSDVLREVRLPLLTSEAVFTEAFYMVRGEPARSVGIWKLLFRGGASS